MCHHSDHIDVAYTAIYLHVHMSPIPTIKDTQNEESACGDVIDTDHVEVQHLENANAPKSNFSRPHPDISISQVEATTIADD